MKSVKMTVLDSELNERQYMNRAREIVIVSSWTKRAATSENMILHDRK